MQAESIIATKVPEHSVRADTNHLTLADVAAMSVGREMDGWYVGPCNGNRWTIGRKVCGEHYPIFMGGKAIAFDTADQASRYLRALVTPVISKAAAPTRSRRSIPVLLTAHP